MMNNTTTGDLQWEAFKGGDRKAFEVIYRTYASTLVHYGLKITPDTMLVEDSIQDLFIELWKSRAQLASTSSIKFYLFRALRFKIQRNKKTSHSEQMDPIEDYLSLLTSSSHEDLYIHNEIQILQLANIKDTLEKLPLRQKEAINLRYYHQFSNEEIAQIMDINYHSACKFIYAGLKNLKENIKMSAMAVSFLTTILFI